MNRFFFIMGCIEVHHVLTGISRDTGPGVSVSMVTEKWLSGLPAFSVAERIVLGPALTQSVFMSVLLLPSCVK